MAASLIKNAEVAPPEKGKVGVKVKEVAGVDAGAGGDVRADANAAACECRKRQAAGGYKAGSDAP